MDVSSLVQTLAVLVMFSVQSLPETIRIGGILTDEAEESAFRLAIDFVNNEHLLGVNHTLEYVTNTSGALSSFTVMQIACYQASLGVMAFVGPMSSTAIRSAAPLSKGMSIPQISPVSTNPLFDDESRYPYLIRMMPPDTMQSLALIDLVEAFGWKKIAILTSNTDYGINGLLKFQSSAARRNWQILSVQQFEASDDYKKVDALQQLQVIKTTGVRVVVLNCLAVFGVPILRQAYGEGMLGPGWAWVVTDGITGPAFSANIMDAVVTFAYAVRDITEKEDYKILESNKLNCMKESWNKGPHMLRYLREVVGYGVANDIEFNANASPKYPRYDIVNLMPDGWMKVGHWDPVNHLSAEFNSSKVIFPGNQSVVNDYVSQLANKTLRAVVLNEPPFTRVAREILNSDDIQKGEVEGLCIDLFERLAELTGFKYTMYEVPDKLYGKKDPDTFQWNGLVKELVAKDADIAIAPLTISNPRETDMDFTKPFLDLGMRFIIKVPEVLPERAFRFLDPFQGDVWTMTLLMTVAVGIYVSLLNKLSPYDHHGEFVYCEYRQANDMCYKKYRQLKRIKIQSMSTLNFSNSVWFSIAALLHQGGEAYPKSMSARIALLTWLCAITVLVATYTANLAAFLTTVRSKTTLDSIEELGSQTKIKYGTVTGSAPFQFFEDSEITLFKDMLLYMKQQKTSVNVSEQGVKKAREGGYAFIWDSAVLDYVVEERPCNSIRNVGRLFGKIGYGFGLQKNSPYKDELSYYILKLREEGYIDKLVHKWYVEKGECTKEVESTEQEKAIEAAGGKLGIDQMLGVFIIVLVAIVLSFGVLISEWVVAVQSNVDKKDPFRPDDFSGSLGHRLNSVKNDFVEEGYGCCFHDDDPQNIREAHIPRTVRLASRKSMYKVTEEDVIQNLAGSVARRQKRNLPLSYQSSLCTRSLRSSKIQANGYVRGDSARASANVYDNNAFELDLLNVRNFPLVKRPSYPSLDFDHHKAYFHDTE